MAVQSPQANGPEVADIFRQFGPVYRIENKLPIQFLFPGLISPQNRIHHTMFSHQRLFQDCKSQKCL